MAGNLCCKQTIDLFYSSIKPSMRTIGSCGGLVPAGVHIPDRCDQGQGQRSRLSQQGDLTTGKNGEDRSIPVLLLKGTYVMFLPTHLYGKACI